MVALRLPFPSRAEGQTELRDSPDVVEACVQVHSPVECCVQQVVWAEAACML